TRRYGFILWLPTIIKEASGVSNLTVTLITALPHCVALAAMLFVGWSSDRTRGRRDHTALPVIDVGLGLLLSAVPQNNVIILGGMLCLAAVGVNSFLPAFWSLPTSY